jgi:hypothetical protein
MGVYSPLDPAHGPERLAAGEAASDCPGISLTRNSSWLHIAALRWLFETIPMDFRAIAAAEKIPV